jgi:hypothetical protein
MTVSGRTHLDQQASRRPEYAIALPPADLSLTQDREWCVVRVNGEWRQIRIHDW